MKLMRMLGSMLALVGLGLSLASTAQAQAPAKKPNILFIVSDDTGYGDLGPYGGGEGRGMQTPTFDKMAKEGMTFFSFYAQPSCTPGRAAMQTGRIPNRSGMTTVAFQGEGGGLLPGHAVLGLQLDAGHHGGVDVAPAPQAHGLLQGLDPAAVADVAVFPGADFGEQGLRPDLQVEADVVHQALAVHLLHDVQGQGAGAAGQGQPVAVDGLDAAGDSPRCLNKRLAATSNLSTAGFIVVIDPQLQCLSTGI